VSVNDRTIQEFLVYLFQPNSNCPVDLTRS
jgi:hypothetical protein